MQRGGKTCIQEEMYMRRCNIALLPEKWIANFMRRKSHLLLNGMENTQKQFHEKSIPIS